MKSLVQKSHLVKLLEQRNGYLVLSAGLTALCLLLVVLCFYLNGRERIVLVPPVINKTFWVGADSVSPEYLSEMTAFFADLRLNVTPETIDHQRTLLLRYTDPKYYGALNDMLVAEQDKVEQEHISTAFYPVDVMVDAKQFKAVITGDLQSSVGTTQMPSQRVSYQVTYRYDNGRLLVSQFQEIKTP